MIIIAIAIEFLAAFVCWVLWLVNRGMKGSRMRIRKRKSAIALEVAIELPFPGVKPEYVHGTPRMTVWQNGLGGTWGGSVETFYALEGFSEIGGYWDCGINSGSAIVASTREEVIAQLEKEAQRYRDAIEVEKYVEATTEHIMLEASPKEAGQKRII